MLYKFGIFSLFVGLTFGVWIHFISPAMAAEDNLTGVNIISQKAYGESVPDAEQAQRIFNERIGFIVKFFLSLTGVILLLVIIYAGFLWLTAGGNEKQVEKAQEWLKNGVIGMVLITAAYFLTDFILAALTVG